MNKITIDDVRLLEILEEVHQSERLPELTTEEERELIGEHKLIWDFNTRFDIPHGYWLTKEGWNIMLSLKSQERDGLNSFKVI